MINSPSEQIFDSRTCPLSSIHLVQLLNVPSLVMSYTNKAPTCAVQFRSLQQFCASLESLKTCHFNCSPIVRACDRSVPVFQMFQFFQAELKKPRKQAMSQCHVPQSQRAPLLSCGVPNLCLHRTTFLGDFTISCRFIPKCSGVSTHQLKS